MPNRPDILENGIEDGREYFSANFNIKLPEDYGIKY